MIGHPLHFDDEIVVYLEVLDNKEKKAVSEKSLIEKLSDE